MAASKLTTSECKFIPHVMTLVQGSNKAIMDDYYS